jgi:septal ring factor EnvC (AmiA/AmiB activator)
VSIAVLATLLGSFALVISALSAVYAGVTRNRTARSAGRDDHFTRTIDGFQKLLDEQDEKIAKQGERILQLEADVKSARSEARRANLHAADCEHELRDARRRILELERS